MFSAIQRLCNYCHLPLNELKHSGKPWNAFPTSDKIKTIAEGFRLAQWLVVLASSKRRCTKIGFSFIGNNYISPLLAKSRVSIKSYWCTIYCVTKCRETVKIVLLCSKLQGSKSDVSMTNQEDWLLAWYKCSHFVACLLRTMFLLANATWPVMIICPIPWK